MKFHLCRFMSALRRTFTSLKMVAMALYATWMLFISIRLLGQPILPELFSTTKSFGIIGLCVVFFVGEEFCLCWWKNQDDDDA
jgi:hypothetical protein